MSGNILIVCKIAGVYTKRKGLWVRKYGAGRLLPGSSLPGLVCL